MDYIAAFKEAKLNNYQIGICAKIVDDNQRVLLVQRAADENYPGIWELPGGGLEDNEEIIDGLVREVKEETGLNVVSGNIKYLKHFEFHNIETNKHKRKFCFEVKTSGKIKLSKEHQKAKWFTKEDVKNSLIDSETCPTNYNIWIDHYKFL